jgi:peptidoglycan hydrolase-like protein with peptidoglycan-binding domain
MKTTKARVGGILVLTSLALASFPVASVASDRHIQYNRRGAEFGVYSEPIRLSLSTPIVEQVQRALRQRGYYRGEIDGFMGDNTQIAIQMFYVDNCHRVAPVITRWLLARLGIGSEGKSALRPGLGQARYPTID